MLTSYNVVLISSLMMFISVIFIFFIFWYNNRYILKNKSDFDFLFFGERNYNFKGSYAALNFLFLNLIIVDRFLLVFFNKTIFPTRGEVENKMKKLTLNAYKDNVNFFKSRHRSWLKLNLYLNFFIFISGAFFFVCYFFITKNGL